ncbi:MAG TPA: PEP/pyruvate-binding domain-containing protein [Thermoanaerobaculia bacterium]|jgi:CheY-like chemotaxis protein|nr:PEP/pyruvate-binding domain-containing protein [Thermoanaerobaculia bacterium]
MPGSVVSARRFHGLMPYRVREVLLVASPYDAFTLEEDGLLTEQVFLEYMDVSQPGAPRFTHARSGEEAMAQLRQRRFDLVLTTASLPDMPAERLSREVKALRPGRPVVLLALDRAALPEPGGPAAAQALDRGPFDAAFLWGGDAKILLAIIKSVEDRENVDHDIATADVRAILILEDSPRYYSSFLGMLYKELMQQSHSLYSEGVDEMARQLYMKSRPKVLHATTWEEGMALFERYRRHVMAVICDLRLPRGGVLDEDAGLAFARHARKSDPELPVLLQSSVGIGSRRAAAMGVGFLDKGSPTLLADLSEFLRLQLGFGDFVFRTRDGGEEVGRAHDLRELEQQVAVVPEESIAYHAARNHFSIWLLARSEFELAEQLRPQRAADFPSVAALRTYLLGLLRDVHERAQQGVVADFSAESFAEQPFTRLGHGSMGGKGRSIAFLYRTLAGMRPEDFGGLEVRLPRTLVVATEHFERFLEQDDLAAMAARGEDDEAVRRRLLAAPLPAALQEELATVVAQLPGPLAVRSSSLLEDSLQSGLAGLFDTVMVPNVDPDPRRRLRELGGAVKRVYASLFSRAARRYLESTGYLLEEEKMAVVIQAVVGRRRGDRFYPSFSGVAQSFNYYPFGPQRAEEGVVHLALGLGRTIVEGGRCLRFSPARPEVLPQFATSRAMLDNSQNGFYALDLRAEGEAGADRVRWFDLAVAEADGALHAAGSVVSPGEQRVRDDLDEPGPRVVTFNNLLRHRAIPLAEALRRLLDVTQRGLGGPVELELAGDMGDWGWSASAAGAGREPPRLYLLQLRPMAAQLRRPGGPQLEPPLDECLCRASSRVLGHGTYAGIRDLVHVRREAWEARHHRAIAAEIGALNERLRGEGRRYVLVGPGRWGTADPLLGIPVEWSQISEVQVLVEASPAGYDVEPSQGAHFFQNITSLQLGYLTVPPGADADGMRADFLDWRWLEDHPAATTTTFLRHLRFDEPLAVELDGARGRGWIGKTSSE